MRPRPTAVGSAVAGGPGRRRSRRRRSASAQRPATWSAGGARSSSRPATKPRTAANCGPRTSAAPTTTSSTRLGTTPCQAKCGKSVTCSTSGDDDSSVRPSARGRCSSAGSRRPRSRRGRSRSRTAPRRRPGRATRSRRTARSRRAARCSREAGVDAGHPADRHAGDVRRAALAAPGDDRVVAWPAPRSGRPARGRGRPSSPSRRGRSRKPISMVCADPAADRRVGVDDEQHGRGGAGDPQHPADQAVVVEHGHVGVRRRRRCRRRW